MQAPRPSRSRSPSSSTAALRATHAGPHSRRLPLGLPACTPPTLPTQRPEEAILPKCDWNQGRGLQSSQPGTKTPCRAGAPPSPPAPHAALPSPPSVWPPNPAILSLPTLAPLGPRPLAQAALPVATSSDPLGPSWGLLYPLFIPHHPVRAETQRTFAPMNAGLAHSRCSVKIGRPGAEMNTHPSSSKP